MSKKQKKRLLRIVHRVSASFGVILIVLWEVGFIWMMIALWKEGLAVWLVLTIVFILPMMVTPWMVIASILEDDIRYDDEED